MEISAMGMMLSNFYQGVSSRTSRSFLQEVNVASSVPGSGEFFSFKQYVYLLKYIVLCD